MGLNEDMPWVNLTQEEVNELRAKKHELTEYGKQRLKQMIDQFAGNYEGPLYAPHPDLMTPYPDEMFEEAERREAERKALDALDKHYEENGPAFGQLAYIERLEREEEIERSFRKERVLQRYNDYYNMECASLPHGTPITPEQQQMITLQSMIDALRCEYLNQEYNQIAITDIEDLIEQLDKQATQFLQRVRQNNER
jgi:hypothetical protein